MKIVHLRQPLLRSGGSQEVDIFVGAILAEGELIDFFLAAKQVRISLEEALLEVVEDGHAKRLHSQAALDGKYALPL